ncbi:hypothetical protein CXB51_011832 [Gossypium anomalum]|uniref:Reverse transcriptase domain-containing protein n=1 Tax=Gossypium anomalum TaxID=47600 RepID=A0A8J5Z906_9ROSI|nr:hypothetical protein CXB51_011832 [Gossypium anomalum]
MDSNISIFSWNCQGCASSKFILAFHEYNLEHNPDIVCLLEPRVSGPKANSIIGKLGFDFSHRIESVGFSGGIWDLGFVGSSFTWQRGSRYERLDRALANDAWILTFLQTLVYHLTRIKSDHRPILLKTNPTLNTAKGRPFCFLTGWTKHANFKDLTAKKWIFSGTRKRQLMKLLGNIQKAMDQSTFRRLFKLEMEAKDELENVLNHEELLWRQKARLYGEIPSPMPNLPSNIFLRLKESEIDYLSKPVLNVEIKKALFNMAPLKAPRCDGYHELFFQSQWDLLEGAKDYSEDYSHFQPISLCSVMYKLVMKMIANRFKVVFPNFISSEQAGFIAGRNISDNIIIAQEVIHSMRSRKDDKKWMAIKLNLEKSYDRISWEFISASLVAAGIPNLFRKLIMDAISSSTMWILWNGVPSKSFKPLRGVRQRCPLSPYWFVLCMDWLCHLIRSNIAVGRWSPIPLSRKGPLLSHLFFCNIPKFLQ